MTDEEREREIERVGAEGGSLLLTPCEACKAHEQSWLEAIIEEIEPHIIGDFNRLWWQALKERVVGFKKVVEAEVCKEEADIAARLFKMGWIPPARLGAIIEELSFLLREKLRENTSEDELSYPRICALVSRVIIPAIKDAGYIKPCEMPVLSPEEIGDCLDCEIEGTYPCTDGSIVGTISVDKLLQDYTNKIKKWLKGEK